MELRNLFSPISIGNLEIKNRIVLSPMGIGSYNPDETITDEYISFIEARSRETGLLITTAARVTNKYGKRGLLGCYDDTHIPSLKKLVSAAHRNGAKIFLQIVALGGGDIQDPYVPSLAVPFYSEEWIGDVRPKELETEQIKELVQDHIHAIALAREAGFDGVELDGAENFLIADFLCPYTNRRTDEYGGSFENRVRFPAEIIRGAGKLGGTSFPVGFKYNAYHDLPNGIDLELGVKIAKRMVEAGAAYIHEWSFARLDKPMSLFSYPPMPNLYQPRNTTVPIAEHLKNSIKDVPIIAVGGITRPEEADRIISEGKADLIALGRAFIADQLWAYKAKRGQRIRPCLRCHVCHHEIEVRNKTVTCSINPDVFSNGELKRAESPKRVMVVGGGPGGITAAVTASKRGHRVILYERKQVVGGMVIPGSAPDFKYEYGRYLEYLGGELHDSDVEVITDCEVTAEFIKKNAPDVLIVATGAVPVLTEIPGIKNKNVVTAADALINADKYHKKKVVVIGGGDVGCETVLLLAMKGNQVTIVEILNELMKDEDIKYNTVVLEGMIKESGVRVLLNTELVEVLPGRVKIKELERNETSELPADVVVLSAGFRAEEGYVKNLLDACGQSYALGDCVQPGRLRQAIEEGYRIGNLI
ncbi:MAG: FAD-dependent oxidoreductase [Spirochaetota bacterium]|nr:MAG: FAD-dependent oxidoreductase [Spirochaetota bacterium]